MQRCAVRASRLGQLAGARRLASTSKIVWTYTDEAPALATFALLPVVKRFTDEMEGERWMMWYSGRSGQIEADAPTSYGLRGSGCVGHAISKDGLVWERLAGDEVGGSCLGPNEESWWCFDTKHVSVGDVNVLSSQIVQNNMGLYVTGLSP